MTPNVYGKTWTWAYDNAGNITSRNEYAYTTGELGVPLDTVIYAYTDPDWGDLLTAYDGTAITYDTIGNPLYDGTWTYTWEHGRRLASMTAGTTTWSYSYNADGLRTGRTDGTNTYQYVYTDGQLSAMYYEGTRYLFHYEGSTPVAMYIGGTAYYYAANINGDVVAIFDNDGNRVVEYTYDAWGNILSVSGSMADTIGAINPLRYRGYVYDTETGLYYVSSRYYNPEIGRWINTDNRMSGIGGDILGYNTFAYCMNNPVNMSDPTGNWPRWITAAVTVVAAVVTVAAAATGNFAVAAVAAKVTMAAGVAYLAQSAHYDDRASKNTGMDEMTYKEAIEIPGADPNVSDTFHDFSGDNNKVCLEDGREGIYDSSGKYVDDPRDIGTYNYFVPKDFWSKAGHVVVDVIPYFIFGNNDNDPGPIVNFAEKWGNVLIALFE